MPLILLSEIINEYDASGMKKDNKKKDWETGDKHYEANRESTNSSDIEGGSQNHQQNYTDWDIVH